MEGNVLLKKGWGTKIFKNISIKIQSRTVTIFQIEGILRSNAVPGLLLKGENVMEDIIGSIDNIRIQKTNKAQCCNLTKFLNVDS